jgi:VWFA-related protein
MVDAYPTAGGAPIADLAQDEFEILEDGVPQRVALFERKTFRAPVPEPLRAEPRDLRESNRITADPRSRVFVLYLDTYHLPGMFEGVDHRPARDALRTWLRSLIGEDDIVALVTPETDVESLTFTRRTAAIDAFLLDRWMREVRIDDHDATERMYQMCYSRYEEQWVEEAMIARKRERQVIDTLRGLITRLGDLRDDRKAVILVGGGWTLFGPDAKLSAPLPNRPLPGQGRIGVGPTGRIGTGRGDDRLEGAFQECEEDRMALAAIEDERDFRSLAGAANRVNVSIYPVDPRGLVATATVAAQDALKRRRAMLYDLASATDGLAVIDTNDYDRGMRRIVDDMSSYYLLGYYSTNTKLDGRFRRVTVRVKRPGAAVRARNGYLAPTAADVAPAAPAAGEPAANPAPASPRAARETAVAEALTELERLDRGREVFVDASWVLRGSGSSREALVTLVVELDGAAARTTEWAGERSAAVTVQDANGRETVAAANAALQESARAVRVDLASQPVRPGAYIVRATVSSPGKSASDSLRIVVPADEDALGRPILFRRAPATGPAYAPTSDRRFRRADRLRIDVPSETALDTVTAALLGRNGRPLAVPVTLGERDGNGTRYVTGEVVLAPLAVGDYLVEFANRATPVAPSVLIAFRIVP